MFEYVYSDTLLLMHFKVYFNLLSNSTMTRTNNILRVLLFSAITALCVLVLVPSASEAHSFHKNPTVFDNTGSAVHKSCPLVHHPLTEPCPGNHYAGNPMIAKECGGNPSGTVPASGSGFSKETVAQALPYGFQPVLEAQNIFAFLPPYQSFISDPSEHPPQSV